MFVCMYVLACLLCLIWACDVLVPEETRGPCGPLMGMELYNHGGMLQGTQSECIPLRCSTRNSRTHERLQTFRALSKNQKTWSQTFGVHTFCRKLACVERMQIQRQHLCWLYILLWHAGFLEAPGLSEGPGVLRLSFVKEPRGPRWGWLEHTWQFEPLGRSSGITSNWLWRLAVSLRLEMVCCCVLHIGRGFGSHRGRKGFFRNQWGGW